MIVSLYTPEHLAGIKLICMMILYSLPGYYTYRVTLVALNFKHNGMDTIIKEIRCSAEEWKNRSLAVP
jgi:hypothetical protein